MYHGSKPAKSVYNELELRKQLQSAMIKVNNLVLRLEKPADVEAIQSEDSGTEKVPLKLKRHEAMFRHTICKDKVVSQLYDEVNLSGNSFAQWNELSST